MSQTKKNIAFRIAKENGVKNPKQYQSWRSFSKEAADAFAFMKRYELKKYPFDEEHTILFKLTYK